MDGQWRQQGEEEPRREEVGEGIDGCRKADTKKEREGTLTVVRDEGDLVEATSEDGPALDLRKSLQESVAFQHRRRKNEERKEEKMEKNPRG